MDSYVQDFWHAQAEWSNKTFGDERARGPIGPLMHLKKEAQEAVEAPDGKHRRREIADCLFLVFDAARRSGMTLDGLLDECWAKLAENKDRVWPPIGTTDGPVEHVRDFRETDVKLCMHCGYNPCECSAG